MSEIYQLLEGIGDFVFACFAIALIIRVVIHFSLEKKSVNEINRKWEDGLIINGIVSEDNVYEVLCQKDYSGINNVSRDENNKIIVKVSDRKYEAKVFVDEQKARTVIVFKLIDGKENYRSATEKNNLYQYLKKGLFPEKEEYKTEARNEFLKEKGKLALIGIVNTVIKWGLIAFVIVVLLYIYSSRDDNYIDAVKNGYNTNYPNITYGELFEKGFPNNPEWSHYETEDGKDIVQYTAYSTENEPLTVRFLIEDDTFSVVYMQLGDTVASSELEIGLIMGLMFETYSDINTLNDYVSSTGNYENPANSYSEPEVTPEAEPEPEPVPEETFYQTEEVELGYDLNYNDTISAAALDYSYVKYWIYDIDKDGIDDLIIGYGENEAEWRMEFYTMETELDGSSYVAYLDFIWGDADLYEAEDGNGIYAVCGSGGVQTVTQIMKSGDQIWQTEIMSGETDEYYENDHPIDYQVYEVN